VRPFDLLFMDCVGFVRFRCVMMLGHLYSSFLLTSPLDWAGRPKGWPPEILENNATDKRDNS
jgi:hypothetical protein